MKVRLGTAIFFNMAVFSVN